VLYVLFFFPGVIALIYFGTIYAGESWGYREVSVYSPASVPVYPLKSLIPLSGLLLLLQGVAEVMRCIVCLHDGAWPRRLHDVEESRALFSTCMKMRAVSSASDPYHD
jgi:TRAP-type mannitol/chloroaromatic compound transport system permease small subunit